MSVFKELNARGIFAQATHPQQIEELIDSGKAVFYIGFDPTADSLHAGNFVQLMAMAHLQRAGNRPIVLLGGGTGMVGDPSGKTDMRKLMDEEIISHNVDCFRKQMSRFLDFGDGNSAPDGKAFFVNNADWLMELKYVDVLREIGAHMSVNKMLTAECFKQRLERGLSFLEFNYMLMQSYDFWELNRRYGCTLQCGGNDQWSNIISGVDLIRRKEQKEAFGLTFNLLLTSDGRKMGKTESGSVWLDADKTSPYDFFQYWRNIDDVDVINCIKMLTFIPLDEIKKYEELEGSALNKVKERLAFEITQIVHGETEADKALKSATAVFSSGIASDDMPTTTISEQDFTDGKITVIELLVKSELCSSKADARRLIDGCGISIEFIQNGKKFEKKPEGIASALTVGDFESGGGFIILRKGKKVFHKILKSQ